MRVVRQSEFTAFSWKNGGGITREAWRVPADGRFIIRMSVAEIDRSGPFSDFAGYARTMVLLRGRGLRLSFGGDPATVLREVGDCVGFDGGTAVDCELLDGPCTDLNLMVCKSLAGVRAGVERLTGTRTLEGSADATVFVFAVQGPVVLDVGTESAMLEPWDCAMVAPAASASLKPAGEVPAALVFLATVNDNSLRVNA